MSCVSISEGLKVRERPNSWFCIQLSSLGALYLPSPSGGNITHLIFEWHGVVPVAEIGV
jgi:hypothetical protein